MMLRASHPSVHQCVSHIQFSCITFLPVAGVLAPPIFAKLKFRRTEISMKAIFPNRKFVELEFLLSDFLPNGIFAE